MKCAWCHQVINGNIFFAFDRSFCKDEHRTKYAFKNKNELINYPTFDNRKDTNLLPTQSLYLNIRSRSICKEAYPKSFKVNRNDSIKKNVITSEYIQKKEDNPKSFKINRNDSIKNDVITSQPVQKKEENKVSNENHDNITCSCCFFNLK